MILQAITPTHPITALQQETMDKWGCGQFCLMPWFLATPELPGACLTDLRQFLF